ncbi:hypothetical protein [Paucibacter soli]|uniref:hypothetical protein n=1 Tax=Paucibacter soli TaxID=3133433 RepID=UPI0030A66277
MQVKLGKPISLVKLAKDPQNWISLMAVLTLLGLCGGVFDPHEVPQEAQMAQADASVRLMVVQADGARERL